MNWDFTHSAPAGGGLPRTSCEMELHTLCTCWWWSSRHFTHSAPAGFGLPGTSHTLHLLVVVFQALLINWDFIHSAPAGGGLPTQAVCLTLVADLVQAVTLCVESVVLIPWAGLVQDGWLALGRHPKSEFVR